METVHGYNEGYPMLAKVLNNLDIGLSTSYNRKDNTVDIFTTKEAAEYLGTSVQTIKSARADGKLTALRKMGKGWVYSKEELDRFAAAPRHAGWPWGKPRPPKRPPEDT